MNHSIDYRYSTETNEMAGVSVSHGQRGGMLPSVRSPSRLTLHDSGSRSALEAVTKKGNIFVSQPGEGKIGMKKVIEGDSLNLEKKIKADALAAMLALDGTGRSTSASPSSVQGAAVESTAISVPSPPVASLSAVPLIANGVTVGGAVRDLEKEEVEASSETYAYKDYAKLVGVPPSGSAHQAFASSSSAADSDSGAIGFPERLYDLLSHPDHARDISDVISWQPHGRSWTILKPKEFERTILPRFYSAKCKYTSFIRQANGWGFRRITQGPDRNSYYHELFLRGLPHLIKLMRRPGVSKKLPSDPENEPDFNKISKESPLPLLPHQAPASNVSAQTLTQGSGVPLSRVSETQVASALPSVAGFVPAPSPADSLRRLQPSALAELLRSKQLQQEAAGTPASAGILNTSGTTQRQQALLSEVFRSARANQEITALLQSNMHRRGVAQAQQQLLQQQQQQKFRQLQQLQLSSTFRGPASAALNLLATSATAGTRSAAAALNAMEDSQQRRVDILRRLSGSGIDRSQALLTATTAAGSHALPPQGTTARCHSEAAIDRHAAMKAAANFAIAQNEDIGSDAIAEPLSTAIAGRLPSRRYSENPSLTRHSAVMAAAAAAAEAAARDDESNGAGAVIHDFRAKKVRRLSENNLDRRGVSSAIATVNDTENAVRRRKSNGANPFGMNAMAAAASIVRNMSVSSLASAENPAPANVDVPLPGQVAAERDLPAIPGGMRIQENSSEVPNLSAIEQRIQNLHSQLHQAMQEREAAASATGQGRALIVTDPARGRRAMRRVSFQDSSSTSAASSASVAEAINSLMRSRSNRSTEF
eukprot:CAMPEP_0113561958 /NCGR_PEP_ID=MMETSP0015_2-20120614/20262_1 /TAXON_ID=2838 /ORGANISM="Odontella" /LENGTH=823 /DNA_ID=CAMNT_0000463805 /DNA_START=13 /DNA_END=2484 /DNA_ORIENTATION=- /assembly_acc=CAM_ASM_000160